ncbi:hypothetical protein HAX54_035052 [Datura stramonium]|uniref:Uncharacterized protein n=1 Tax=Datura stramonium TaxID=4076 RepID=A0ABS8VFW8_DATST|nr:hypothetical protein [Datura stramonium]
MERGSAHPFEETEKFLLEEIEKMGEEIAMTRRKIEQIDHNRDNLLVKTEEVDLQIDWVERRIAEIDLEIAESLRALHKALQSLGILHPIEEGSSEYQFKGKCAYHINQRSHTIDECIALKTKICKMINTGKIRHMWGPHTMLACDQVNPETPITKDVLIYRLDFTAFKECYTTIYQKLVDAKIIYPFQRKKSSRKHNDEKMCPYNSREVRHNIE